MNHQRNMQHPVWAHWRCTATAWVVEVRFGVNPQRSKVNLGLDLEGKKPASFFSDPTALFACYCSQKPSIKKPRMYKVGNREMAFECVSTLKVRDNYHLHAWIRHDDAHEHVGPKQELQKVRLSPFLVVCSTEWKSKSLWCVLVWSGVTSSLNSWSRRREISAFVRARGREKWVLWASGLVNEHDAEYKRTKNNVLCTTEQI